ncbi:hypothetical protein OnM2_039068 [Erysiphe neolycopersici]|uniref:Ilp is an apoptosis inhibitor n=1 Tax=Erysiphe neolycopersici TaxID=212602 RepID=A0A420HWC0_9PEZI|nr:hypothetical protein OnM2_039068 [Erysiphe neolycopersici]
MPKQTESNDPSFDILSWHPYAQNCLCYFLDHAQHTVAVKALASFINIRLPYQRHPNPIISSSMLFIESYSPSSNNNIPSSFLSNASPTPSAQSVSVVPYIRRLVVTGQDTATILQGFFGEDWVRGVGAIHELERRNYLFAAKSTNWIGVKEAYDILPNETVPFLIPLQNVTEQEMRDADEKWSEWIFMQDWILGPRLDAIVRSEIENN